MLNEAEAVELLLAGEACFVCYVRRSRNPRSNRRTQLLCMECYNSYLLHTALNLNTWIVARRKELEYTY